MAFLGFGKKKKTSEEVNLTSLLTPEEKELLIGELQTAAKRLPEGAGSVISETVEALKKGEALEGKSFFDLCGSAITMNTTFSETREGSAQLLKKLESAIKS